MVVVGPKEPPSALNLPPREGRERGREWQALDAEPSRLLRCDIFSTTDQEHDLATAGARSEPEPRDLSAAIQFPQRIPCLLRILAASNEKAERHETEYIGRRTHSSHTK